MDVEGWIPISHIAKFKRMSSLTQSIEVIASALQGFQDVEVDVDGLQVRLT
jgi:hypothetical protein